MLSVLAYGVLVHFIFLASIFVIYFQSPVIQGLRPQSDLAGAPAKRLVLFVADGLRAESFYRDGCGRTPFLRDVILHRGVQGISHTRIPTESRPGHVALIAGLYEDPSAVLRGWQENPVDFDSLFNRSTRTYAWGSPDVLSIFSKASKHPHIQMHSYDPADEDFSGRLSTVRLDQWVFDQFSSFLGDKQRTADGESLKQGERTVFFLHLLGLDTAGHVHKPNSARFDENLAAVDRGVAETVRLVSEYFDDERTAFVFTADHGMTDAGAHGAGMPHETETPFIAWGAGFAHWRRMPLDATSATVVRRTQRVGDVDVPRFDIEQADAAPLMSAVLGVAVPMNNFGVLPARYLSASPGFVAAAMRTNALQMGAQFEHLRRQHVRGVLAGWMGDYAGLNGEMVRATEQRIETALANGKFELATELSSTYLRNTLHGIEYYQQYYQHGLLFAVCLSMAGWLVFLVQKMMAPSTALTAPPAFWSSSAYAGIVGVLIAIVIVFVYIQGIPLTVGAFFILPIICWLPCNAPQALRILCNKHTWLFVLAADVLVWTFFNRAVLGALMLVLPVPYVLSFNGDRRVLLRRNIEWIITCAMLGGFTLLPAVGRTSNNFTILLFGLGAWLLQLSVSTFGGHGARIDRVRLLNWLLFVGAAATVAYVTDGFEKQRGLAVIAQLAAWLITGASMVLPLLQPRAGRLARIADSLCMPYALMSLSYEPLFLFVLARNLGAWVRMERRERSSSSSTGNGTLSVRDFRRAYVVLAYVLLSFFGTGNLASISSFDPNAVRCYVGTFSPFVMAALIVMKLFVPVLLVMCASTAITAAGALQPTESGRFIIVVLLICDIMCAHFLFFVRNTGSWLDIGVSISHFVIMESTVLVLCVLEWLSRRLLRVRLVAGGRVDVDDDNDDDEPKME